MAGVPVTTNDKKPVDLVLSGGGVKFIGLVGAVVALMDAGYSIQRVSGVSGGSVVGALVAAASKGDQLTGEQVRELALSVPLHTWRDAGPVPVVGPLWGFVSDAGFYRGDVAHDWIRSELKNLGVNTFGDLALDDENLLPERRYRAVVSVTDLTNTQLVRLPWQYRRFYGLNPDEQPVADAVRASMAVPFFYRPATLTDAAGRKSLLVDGGVLSNFPIDSFDRPDGQTPVRPTFGVTVAPNVDEGLGEMVPALKSMRALGQVKLLERLLTTMLVGHDQAYLTQPWVSARTIQVDSTDVGVLDFDAPRSQLEKLYDNGYAATRRFLAAWDWPAYLERFRWSHNRRPPPRFPG
jgi:NTE family protein